MFLHLTLFDLKRDRKIYEIGCLKSGEIWIEDNSFYVAMVVISVFVAKVTTI